MLNSIFKKTRTINKNLTIQWDHFCNNWWVKQKALESETELGWWSNQTGDNAGKNQTSLNYDDESRVVIQYLKMVD